MFLLCFHLKSKLFASLATYAISQVIINIAYLALCTRPRIRQHTHKFSDKSYYCGIVEEKLDIYETKL